MKLFFYSSLALVVTYSAVSMAALVVPQDGAEATAKDAANRRFRDAVHYLRTQEVEQALKDGAAVNQSISDTKSVPPLVWVAQKKATPEVLELAKLLLNNRANVNMADDLCRARYYSPLQFAIEHRNQPLVKLFLDAGADVDHKSNHDSGRETPLGLALQRPSIEIVKLVLSARPNLDVSHVWETIESLAQGKYEDVDAVEYLKLLQEYKQQHKKGHKWSRLNDIIAGNYSYGDDSYGDEY